MRIGIGLVVLSDLIIRSGSMEAHYTSEGILPVKLLQEFDYKPLRWSLHYLDDSFAYQSLLFIIHGIITLFFIIGYRTKLFSIFIWIFVVSLQNRNPFIQQGGDDLLRLVLFWGMFMPWGNFYSVDAKRLRASIPRAINYFSVASLGYLILICSVYFFSALYKTSPEWRTEGTAVYYALSLDQIKIGLGDWLYEHPALMKILTFVVYYGFEIAAPLLILLPLKNHRFRLAGIIGILLLHIGIASTLYVGLFYIIGITSSFGLLPSSVMDWIDKRIVHTKQIVSRTFIKRTLSFPGAKLFIVAKNCFLILMISLGFLMSCGNFDWFPYQMNSKMLSIVNLFKQDQYWGMFSPNIYKDDGWYTYSGFKKDNTVWDIYNNKEGVDTIKPRDIDKMYPTDRWRKFAENFQRNQYNFMRPYYCRYLIRKWNLKHPENHIEGLNITFLEEETLPDYKTKPLKKQNTCLCYENEN